LIRLTPSLVAYLYCSNKRNERTKARNQQRTEPTTHETAIVSTLLGTDDLTHRRPTTDTKTRQRQDCACGTRPARGTQSTATMAEGRVNDGQSVLAYLSVSYRNNEDSFFWNSKRASVELRRENGRCFHISRVRRDRRGGKANPGRTRTNWWCWQEQYDTMSGKFDTYWKHIGQLVLLLSIQL
jgi:hypothetical protein